MILEYCINTIMIIVVILSIWLLLVLKKNKSALTKEASRKVITITSLLLLLRALYYFGIYVMNIDPTYLQMANVLNLIGVLMVFFLYITATILLAIKSHTK